MIEITIDRVKPDFWLLTAKADHELRIKVLGNPHRFVLVQPFAKYETTIGVPYWWQHQPGIDPQRHIPR